MNETRERLMDIINQTSIELYRSEYDELVDALIDNGVIVPQVRVGQTVYRVGDPIKKIYEWDVVCIEVYGYETEYVDDSDNRFTADDIGKTVFTTREAAEAALKARENECTEE
jgi:hypothetical protein